jgi:O-antigen/teichoic acid export membrane protein
MKNSLMLVASNGAGKLITMLIWLLLARFASPGDFSLASYFRTTLNTIISGVNFGYSNYIIRVSVKRGRQRGQALAIAFSIFSLASVFAFALMIFAAQQQLEAQFTFLMFLCVSVAAVTALWVQIYLAVDQAKGRFTSTILFNIFVPIITFLSAVGLILFSPNAYAIAYAAVSVVVLLVIIRLAQINIWHMSRRAVVRNVRSTLGGHLTEAFKLTGKPYLTGLPVIGLKWALETKIIADNMTSMGPYYIAIMVFSLCMTLLFSASQPILVKVSGHTSHYWSGENLYTNFLLMSIIAVVVGQIPFMAYELILPDHDPEMIKKFIVHALILAMLFSYKQGYGRVAIATAQTNVSALDNILTFITLLLLGLFYIHSPLAFIEALMIAAVIGNVAYFAFALRLRGKIALLDFVAIHAAVLLYWVLMVQ